MRLSSRWAVGMFILSVGVVGGAPPTTATGEAQAAEGPSPTTQPSTRPALDLPTFHTKNGVHKGWLFGTGRLTAPQEAYFRRRADCWKPKGREPWIVLVEYMSGSEARVRVYYTPDSAAGRVRKGRYVDLLANGKTDLTADPKADAAMRPAWDKGDRLMPYVQVAPPGSAFEDKVGTRPAVPARRVDLPFPAPTALADQPMPSDGELVALVDFARQHLPFGEDDDPICEFRMGGIDDGSAADLFVVAVGAKDEGGSCVEIQRTRDGLKATQGHGWADSLFLGR